MPLILLGLLGVFGWKIRNDFIQTGTPITPAKVDEVFNYALLHETDIKTLDEFAGQLLNMGRDSQAKQLRDKAHPPTSLPAPPPVTASRNIVLSRML